MSTREDRNGCPLKPLTDAKERQGKTRFLSGWHPGRGFTRVTTVRGLGVLARLKGVKIPFAGFASLAGNIAGGLAFSLAAICLFKSAGVAMAADSTSGLEPAELQIKGYGLIGNLKLKRMLKILNEGTNRPSVFRANFVEDAALLLISQLREDGYLQPRVTAELTLNDGRKMSYAWKESIEEPLPRPIYVRRVLFRVDEGVRFHLDSIQFDGLEAIPYKTALGYFVQTGGLLPLAGNRVYTPEKFKRGIANLTDALNRMGYQTATVTVSRVETNSQTGGVVARLSVKEGQCFIVRTVRREAHFGTNSEPADIETHLVYQPYSMFWQQDFEQGIRTNYYHQGFPDTVVSFHIQRQEATDGFVLLDLLADVRPGPRIRVGNVAFTGSERTRTSVMERRVPLEEGDWLDRVRAERGRYRLSRLGIFDSVSLRYENTGSNDTRNVIYEVDEGKRLEVSLLFGWGSYEMLRGGVQLDQNNVFGLAHHSRLRLTQSFKSSSADYLYTMPEFFGENIDVFLNASGLRREEISFTRLEYGGGVGMRKFFTGADTDVSVRYNYEILRATDTDADFSSEGVQNPGVGALITDLRHDRRDNPLYPHHGYKIFSNIELATEYLGGDVNYQRIDLFGSYHWQLGEGRWLHLGLSHGVAATAGGSDRDLPFNRRFFPGGENTVRGYQQGEASPRNEEGKIVGAETYLLGNIELEQALTPKWSLVFFSDTVGFAREIKDYPVDESLWSVGGGIRWKTLIGPVRLEYGHNLNPRPHDPSGTLHFSLGFPF